ncbi:MAG: hypothetical protein A3K30_00470 [Deltaproteobacteria bacterium RBG_13_51_10]|nr:MAG: hypothetical protein A3K30_00470 [Deltaproteobacteria bacterium RBG_13_51_10]
MAIYDSFCERYGITLQELQKKYSMAQLALLSKVVSLKQKDLESEDKTRPPGNKNPASVPPWLRGKTFANKTNEEAMNLIAGGILR